MHEEHADKFWARVDRDGPTQPHMDTPCWVWTGSRLPKGYGRFYPRNKIGLYAHRVSFEMANGRPIPEGCEVCHTCDHPSCVRPEHLFLGTHLDNVQDCVEKGRHRHGTTRGRDHHSNKLSEADVRQIRAEAAGGDSRLTLAKRYGVSKGLINQIVWRKAWSWLE